MLATQGPEKSVPGPQQKFQKNNFLENFEKYNFLMCFSSGIGSGPSRMAPWTPWIDRKIQKKIQKLDFSTIFSYWILGQLYSTIWTYNSVVGTCQNCRF